MTPRQGPRCLVCGYPETGLASDARCPECGTFPDLRNAESLRRPPLLRWALLLLPGVIFGVSAPLAHRYWWHLGCWAASPLVVLLVTACLVANRVARWRYFEAVARAGGVRLLRGASTYRAEQFIIWLVVNIALTALVLYVIYKMSPLMRPYLP